MEAGPIDQFTVLTEAETLALDPKNVTNFNIGVMGHVDSGKTSLCRLLSTQTSTAGLDKHPESQERGITIDLGFTCFAIKMGSEDVKVASDEREGNNEEELNTVENDVGNLTLKEVREEKELKEDKEGLIPVQKDKTQRNPEVEASMNLKKFVRFTLVDCPGHAAFVKSVIAGARIIDLMLLVVDAQKGIQIQTAECLAIGETLGLPIIVVLNKTDSLPETEREAKLTQLTKIILGIIKKAGFPNRDNPPVLRTSCVGVEALRGGEVVRGLVKAALPLLKKISRDSKGPFTMIADHCFAIKGKGAVFTGTVLRGRVGVGDWVEAPELGLRKAVKGIQSFKQAKATAEAGDRVAILLGQVQSAEIERCLLVEPGTVERISASVARLQPCRFFKKELESGSRFQITIGHLTLQADITLFKPSKELSDILDLAFGDNEGLRSRGTEGSILSKMVPLLSGDFEYIEGITSSKIRYHGREEALSEKGVLALLRFQKPVALIPGSEFLGTRYDSQGTKKECRLLFSGKTLAFFSPAAPLPLRFIRRKRKSGTIERIASGLGIVSGLFKKESKIDSFVGAKTWLENSPDGPFGKIVGSFGASGKVKVSFDSIPKTQLESLVGSTVFVAADKILNV